MASSKPGRCHGSHTNFASELAVEFFQLALAVGAGRDSDGPVGMQMIDVVVGQEGVQRRVNGGGNAVLAEGGKRIVSDHLVFVRLAAIETL